MKGLIQWAFSDGSELILIVLLHSVLIFYWYKNSFKVVGAFFPSTGALNIGVKVETKYVRRIDRKDSRFLIFKIWAY